MSNILENDNYTPPQQDKVVEVESLDTIVPVGIILSFALKPNTKYWQLCDGSAINSSSKAYKLGLRNTPNLINRYMMGSNTYGTFISQSIQWHSHTTKPHKHRTVYGGSERYGNKERTCAHSGSMDYNRETTETTVVVNTSGSTYTRPFSISVLFYMRIN